jgi:adenine deaminase
MEISGRIIDIHNRLIFPGKIFIQNGKIKKIEQSADVPDQFIMPGLIDSHIHIESSMVTPGSFARAAVSRGTTAVVSDPHEIANVLGIEGVHYMIDDSKKVPLKFYFGAPSCVPATGFERNGATLGLEDIHVLMKLPEIKFLSEMMNFPGVINRDREVMGKIETAKKEGKPIDGHAPGLTGEELAKYVQAGISTDHECSSIDEAKEKIELGMKVIIREGSAARNMEALKPLFKTKADMIMLCSDDLHPEMLAKGHINKLVARLITDGYDLFDVIRSCTLNPALHYNLEAGLLKTGDPADIIVVDDYHTMNILETWIDGEKVFGNGLVNFVYENAVAVNKFNSSFIKAEDISVRAKGDTLRVIQAFDKELLTKEILVQTNSGEFIRSDINDDILKIVVKDRYFDSPPAVGFIKGFRLKHGAFASSVAHDSHNIICVGVSDDDIVNAVNEIVSLKGGLAVCDRGEVSSLQLKIAGIMSDRPCESVASDYESLSAHVQDMGCRLSAPFMTLSFMALLVIPELKISDSGLFDGKNFCHVPLFATTGVEAERSR